MKNKSFEEIKVSDICKEAHINRSTFYNNFNDKYDLLFSLFHEPWKKVTIIITLLAIYFTIHILKNIAENIKNHPLYNEEIPSEIITIFYANGVISICLEYIKNPKKYTKNSILKYISKLIPDNLC